MQQQSQHIVPDQHGGWSVRKTGASRATRIFGVQNDAIEFAKHIAQREGSPIYIHSKDGTILSRISSMPSRILRKRSGGRQ
jgi:Uncharacterized protein conserved in bacteria (DUF2188)